MRTLCFIIISSFIMLSCTGREEYKPYEINSNFKVTSKTLVDYEFVRYFVLSSCMECHAERVRPNFADFASVKEHIEEIGDEIVEGAMPPSEDGYRALSECQKEVLDFWITEGMPESEGTTMSNSTYCF